MLTLLRNNEIKTIPAYTGWLLSDIGEYKGMQELYKRQAPQRLKTLKEFAIVESAVSSNRIEGVEIEQSRINTVVFGNVKRTDRNEEEIHGYKQALNLVHSEGNDLPLTIELIKRLHMLCRGDIWDAGKYKEKEGDIIQTYPNGRSRVRFRTVSARDTPEMMDALIQAWETVGLDNVLHPLICASLFNLDFLCIHPFRDGNGRVSRLLFLLQMYHYGYEVGQFISIERLIEENKERYYETLEEASGGWHEGKNDPWTFVNYMLFIIKRAYSEFEKRAGENAPRRGEKTNLVRQAVDNWHGNFSVAEIKQKCPEASLDLIRKILKDMKKEGLVDTTGKGRSAVWYKLGNND